MIIKRIANFWAKDLHPTYRSLTEKESELLRVARCASRSQISEDDQRLLFPGIDGYTLIDIIERRIHAHNLPIKFTVAAKVAVMAYVRIPGEAVLLLIDCLNGHPMGYRYHGHRLVDVDFLENVYPWGFYDEATFTRYIRSHVHNLDWGRLY